MLHGPNSVITAHSWGAMCGRTLRVAEWAIFDFPSSNGPREKKLVKRTNRAQHGLPGLHSKNLRYDTVDVVRFKGDGDAGYIGSGERKRNPTRVNGLPLCLRTLERNKTTRRNDGNDQLAAYSYCSVLGIHRCVKWRGAWRQREKTKAAADNRIKDHLQIYRRFNFTNLYL